MGMLEEAGAKKDMRMLHSFSALNRLADTRPSLFFADVSRVLKTAYIISPKGTGI